MGKRRVWASFQRRCDHYCNSFVCKICITRRVGLTLAKLPLLPRTAVVVATLKTGLRVGASPMTVIIPSFAVRLDTT